MAKLKLISSVLIALSAFTGLLSSLLPSERNRKIFKIIISCVVVISVIACISQIKLSDFSIDTDTENDTLQKAQRIEEKIDLSVESVVAEETEKYLGNALSEKEIFPDNVTVITDRNPEDSIYIKEIKIILNQDQKYLKEAVRALVQKYADEQTTVTVG